MLAGKMLLQRLLQLGFSLLFLMAPFCDSRLLPLPGARGCSAGSAAAAGCGWGGRGCALVQLCWVGTPHVPGDVVMAGAGSVYRSCTGLGGNCCLKQPLQPPMTPIPQGLWVCGGPSDPSRPVGCWQQRSTRCLGLCLPVLGLTVPPVTGYPVPAPCCQAGLSRDQGKDTPLPCPGILWGCLLRGAWPCCWSCWSPWLSRGDRHCSAGRGVSPGPLQGCLMSPSPVPGGPSRPPAMVNHQQCRCVGV